ncbi:flavin monoamine oxidase family protein [Pyxidicoccus caerfyrddinensis]|uniref:flavin monoamine oxidase family protein n=1 Tax=Pyxidicoccus caerfyrddinensis TaxID=2709663 RepID=UPI0013D9E2A2|nr:NAD(P)/FAD-dependent oxidoreductase [Pyxidicoccus caerfyrddinensis]
MDLISDVVILGAGASGLAAAASLRRAGLRVAVLEARERWGGRVATVHDPVTEVPLELGAEFVHGAPESLRKLARRARLSIRACNDMHALSWKGRFGDGEESFRFLDALASAKPPDRPVAELLRERAKAERWSPLQVAMGRAYVEGFYAANPDTASTLAIARMETAAEELGGTTPSRVMEGYDRVLRELARPLMEHPGTVFLNAVAEEVRWAAGEVRVRVRTRQGVALGQVRAKQAVVTLPLGVLRARPPEPGAVRFVPRLPEKERACGRLEMGALVKVLLRFRTAFWSEREDTRRFGFFHGPSLPVPTWWTLSPRESRHLVGWAGGPGADALTGLQEEEVLASAVESLARIFRLPRQALHELLEAWHVQDWQREPFTRGGYAVIPAGAADAMEALATPVEGTLFFAGEATNTEGEEGTVHGAIATGERAAREVLARTRRRM